MPKDKLKEGPAPAITPDMLSEIKKEDMQQAVVERFKGNTTSKKSRGSCGRGLKPCAAND